MAELVRCFIALELSREAIDYVEEIQRMIKKKNLFNGKFTEPENLHLTLKFLSEITPEKVEETRKLLSQIKFKTFEAHLDQLGFFTEDNFRIVWMKLAGKGVWDLQKEIDNKLGGHFKKEERFMGHITIARIKKVHDKKLFLDYIKNMKIKKISFQIKDFVFKKSELKREGPVYADIEKFNLINE